MIVLCYLWLVCIIYDYISPLPSPKRGNQGRNADPKGEAVLPFLELEGLRRCILNLPNSYGVPANRFLLRGDN
jgi:hypothetical protein